MSSSLIFTVIMHADMCENKGVASVSLKWAMCLPLTDDLNVFISPHLNCLSKMNTITSAQMRIRRIAKTTLIISPESPGSASASLDTIICVKIMPKIKKNAISIDEQRKPSMFLKSDYTYLTSLTLFYLCFNSQHQLWTLPTEFHKRFPFIL